MSSKQIVSNDHHAYRFFRTSANSWLGLDFFPSKGGKCMAYPFDLRSLLSPRTSIGFHKRLKITRGRNKSQNQRPRLGTKFRDRSLQASKWYLKSSSKLLALIPDTVMHFTPRTSFRGIEDVEYIPKFGYRNLLNPIFFHIIV